MWNVRYVNTSNIVATFETLFAAYTFVNESDLHLVDITSSEILVKKTYLSLLNEMEA